MRKDAHYDLVFELRFPLGESSDLAHDTWARDINLKLDAQDIPYYRRAVRTGDTLQVVFKVNDFRALAPVFGMALRAVAPQSPGDIAVTVHERDTEPVKVPETMSIEEVQDA